MEQHTDNQHNILQQNDPPPPNPVHFGDPRYWNFLLQQMAILERINIDNPELVQGYREIYEDENGDDCEEMDENSPETVEAVRSTDSNSQPVHLANIKKRERADSPSREYGRNSKKCNAQDSENCDGFATQEVEPIQDTERVPFLGREQISQSASIDNAEFQIPKKYAKVPPMMIQDRITIKEINKLCEKKLNHKFYDLRSYNTGQIKLQLKTLEDYRTMQAALVELNLKFHTNMIASEKPFKYVIKGLPPDMDESEIAQDLMSQGLTLSKVTRLKRRDGKPLNIIYVQLPKIEQNKDIFKITRVNQVIVTVESLRKKRGATQCYNCQGFHHSALTCYKPTVCPKCAGNHRASQCSMKHWGPNAKCANCGGNHVASFRGCEKFPKPRNFNIDKTSYAQTARNGMAKQSANNQAVSTNRNADVATTSKNSVKSQVPKTGNMMKVQNSAQDNLMMTLLNQVSNLSNQVAMLAKEINFVKSQQHGK